VKRTAADALGELVRSKQRTIGRATHTDHRQQERQYFTIYTGFRYGRVLSHLGFSLQHLLAELY
jgi:hypothetical protein